MARIPLRAYTREIEDLIEHEQFDQAIAHCKHILTFLPKHTDTYRLLGQAYLESQRYSDAADVFQRVLSSMPEDFIAHLGMSLIREDEGNMDEAIWHMERAFEMQPANAAVQGELRRLYGRRDGLEPQKVRLTRGALARMYVKGDLYPQAIAELRAALVEDPQRLDLLSLLAKTYYLAGQKAEAADTASSLLKKLPNSLEANRLLAVILAGSERAAEAESFHQRVKALDPYAEHTSPDAPTPDRVPEATINVERLEWSPSQPAVETGSQPEWGASPDFHSEVLPSETRESAPQQEQGEIPDWMKGAGWEPSSGQVEEPSSVSAFEEGSFEEEIAPAEIPDWLQPAAQAPDEQEAPALASADEELPAGSETPQATLPPEDFLPWLSETQPGPTDSILNWLEEKSPPTGPDESHPAIVNPDDAEETEIPEWIQGLGEAKSPGFVYDSQEETGEPLDLPDWLTGSEPEESSGEIPEWLKGVADQSETEAGMQDEGQPFPDENREQAPRGFEAHAEEVTEWRAERDGLAAEPEIAPGGGEEEGPADETPDWLKTMNQEAIQPDEPAAGEPAEDEPASEERDSAFDWLEGLADRQGAGAVMFPAAEESMEADIDWMGQSSEQNEPETSEMETRAAFESETQLPQGDLPDWLQELAPASPPETTPLSPGMIGIFPFPTNEEQPSSAEPGDLPEWLRETVPAEEELPASTLDRTPETAPQGEESPAFTGWLGGLDEGEISEEDTKPTRVSGSMEVPIPPELSDFVMSPAAEPAADQSSDTAPFEEPIPEATFEEPAQPSVEEDSAFSWLDGLLTEQGETVVEPGTGEAEFSVAGAQVFEAAIKEEPVQQVAEPEEAAVEAPLMDLAAEDVLEQPEEALEPGGGDLFETEAYTFLPSEDEAGAGMGAYDAGTEPISDEEPVIESASALPDWLYSEEDGQELELQAEQPADEAAVELEPLEERSVSRDAEGAAATLDLNEASLTDLEKIPLIGLVGAQAILAYRESHGQFSTVEDLRNVPGFDEETIAQLQDRVTTRRPTPEEPAEIPVDWSEVSLIQARNALSQSSREEALEHYSALIKSRHMLPEVIQDLHEALYQYPDDVPLYQALGDAYARSDQLQDALDTYTKAEELLR